MKAHEQEGLWRALEQLAADLEAAKAKGAAAAAEHNATRPTRIAVEIFESTWTESMCREGAARIRSLCDSYLKPKKRRAA